MSKIAAIEAGGTKFICAIGNENGEIFEKITVTTTTPEQTLNLVIEFFKDKEFEAIGVASFGPIDPVKASKTYGYITSTPKPNWSNYNLIGRLKNSFNVPMQFDTDVNGAALGESLWGAGKGLKNLIYLTVGTGIGGGAIVNGNSLQGLSHPEMGHIFIKRHPDDKFIGICPFHNDCLEGLASGPAIESRWNEKSYQLTNNPEVWKLEAYYLAQALVNYILTLSPERIIMGGGVMKQSQLFPMIRKEVIKLLNGYIALDSIINNIDNYIVYPELGDEAGIKGALALGKIALEN